MDPPGNDLTSGSRAKQQQEKKRVLEESIRVQGLNKTQLESNKRLQVQQGATVGEMTDATPSLETFTAMSERNVPEEFLVGVQGNAYIRVSRDYIGPTDEDLERWAKEEAEEEAARRRFDEEQAMETERIMKEWDQQE